MAALPRISFWQKALILLGGVLALAITALIFFVIYFFVAFAHSLQEANRVEFDVQKYTERLAYWKKYNSPELVEHFPEVIPGSATNVSFSMFPGFLQGGAWMNLKVGVSASEARRIQEEAWKKAPRLGDRRMNFPMDREKVVETVPEIQLYSPRAKRRNAFISKSLPSDYLFFVFEAKPGGTKEETNYDSWEKKIVADWNHGVTSGIAVSLERNEVFYWAENW